MAAKTVSKLTVVRVLRRVHGVRAFKFGKETLIYRLPVAAFPIHRLVRVTREGKVIDTGKTIWMGGHYASGLVDGLHKVGSKRRIYASAGPPAHPGYLDVLTPSRLKVGDVVEVPLSPQKLRAYVTAWSECTRLP